jgi:hypothetical protein
MSVVVIDENEIVIESWAENTETSTSWNEVIVQTGGGSAE